MTPQLSIAEECFLRQHFVHRRHWDDGPWCASDNIGTADPSPIWERLVTKGVATMRKSPVPALADLGYRSFYLTAPGLQLAKDLAWELNDHDRLTEEQSAQRKTRGWNDPNRRNL